MPSPKIGLFLRFYNCASSRTDARVGLKLLPEAASHVRDIKTPFNFDPPVSPEEIREVSLQFVRKISGFVKSSKAHAAHS